MSNDLIKYFPSRFLLVFIFPLVLHAQNKQDDFPYHHIEYLNSAQGLNGTEVYWAIQDRNGFMWFITDMGLNRFDGYSFRFYGYQADDVNSPATDWHYGLMEDKNGTLWFPSQSQGLYSFDPLHEKFTNYRHQTAEKNSLAHNRVTAMDLQDDSIVWTAAPSGIGLDKFDPKTKLFTHLDFDSAGLPISFIYCHYFDKRSKKDGGQGNLWLINNAGPDGNARLDCYNLKTGRVISHHDFPFHANLPQHAIRTDGIKHETIWIGSDDNGIHGFNIVSKQFILIKPGHPSRNKTLQLNKAIGSDYYAVMEDHAGNLWTSNGDNEIVFYDSADKKYYYQPVPKNKVSSLFLFIYEDKSRKIWFCTDNGLIAVDTKQKNISVCQHDDSNANSISGNFIYGIHRVKNGPLFVGTDVSVDSFSKQTKSFTPFPILDSRTKFGTGGIWIIAEDSRDNIWFTGIPGLICYNRKTGKNRIYRLLYGADSTEYKTDGCIGILEGPQGKYWTPRWGSGLFLFDSVTGKSRIFRSEDKPNSLTTNDISTLYQDSKGIIYTCGWGGGFITFNPVSETFKIYHHDPKDPSTVSHETAHSFFETKSGLIWFGTIGGGINVFNPATGKFKAFTVLDGLAHNNVCTLLVDMNGNHWAGTSGGISRFTLPDDPFAAGCKIKFRNYDINDGLPSNQLNWSSAFCDTDGTLYFGTRGQGLFYFHPDSLEDNDFIPPVYITELRLKNKLVTLNDSSRVLQYPIEFTKEIHLDYEQNMISLSFAALNYVRPEKNKYAYMLEGYDEDWVTTDASKRFANYTNLDPGEYIFKVKASNNDELWNERPTELRIFIAPPFWKTVWFKLIVILIGSGMAYAFYRYRIGQLLMLQRIRNKIASDLHDDIGSTLNSISVFSEVARKDPAKRDYSMKMIGESSRKIIDSMSDIVWSINPENDSFDKIIFRMRSHSYNLLKAKKIDCNFASDDTLNEINLSMEKRRNFYLIFKEALNNIVKYSQAARVSVLVSHERGSITCIVRDDGIGFDNNREYSGNGLGNMKMRAEEIGASLIIESAPGKGTSVELNLKL